MLNILHQCLLEIVGKDVLPIVDGLHFRHTNVDSLGIAPHHRFHAPTFHSLHTSINTFIRPFIYSSINSKMNAVSSSSSTNMPSPDRALSQNHDEDTLLQVPGREEMRAIFVMCRKNQWNSVLRCVQNNPMIPITSMIMDNHISTTILHQAITSKGNTVLRSRVMRKILDLAPQAATIKNGYGSLPLHVISQRNTKMDAPTKELLIGELVRSFQGALLQPGGVGKRTPLHIIFTGAYIFLLFLFSSSAYPVYMLDDLKTHFLVV